MLERSGMAEDLLDTIGQLFGTVRGGLAYAVIFVGALLAATTGVVAASVISMGLISLPIMLRYGYDRRLASGVIAASGTLAQIIPPSLVLIVMADQLGRSVGDMYEGAFIPGRHPRRPLCRLRVPGDDRLPEGGAGPAAGRDRLPRARRRARRVAARRPGALLGGSSAITCCSRPTLRRGADFVILTICVATVVALICALMNRMLGAQRVVISAVARGRPPCGLVLAAGATATRAAALFIEMIAAGALYALVVGARRALHGLAADVAHGRAGHLRDGAAAAADLPRARHDLHRPRDADRRRRHGRARLADPRRDQAPARQQPDALQLRRSSSRPPRRPRSSPPSCSSSWSARGCSRSPSTASTGTSGSSTC